MEKESDGRRIIELMVAIFFNRLTKKEMEVVEKIRNKMPMLIGEYNALKAIAYKRRIL